MHAIRPISKRLFEALIADAQPELPSTGIQAKALKFLKRNEMYNLKKLFTAVKDKPADLTQFQIGLQRGIKALIKNRENQQAIKSINSLRFQFPDQETGLSSDSVAEAELDVSYTLPEIYSMLDDRKRFTKLAELKPAQWQAVIGPLSRGGKHEILHALFESLTEDDTLRSRYHAAMSNMAAARVCYFLSRDKACSTGTVICDFLKDRADCKGQDFANLVEEMATETLNFCSNVDTCKHFYIGLFTHLDKLSGHKLSDTTIQRAAREMKAGMSSYQLLEDDYLALQLHYLHAFECVGPDCNTPQPV
jgi:hypothetical protein